MNKTLTISLVAALGVVGGGSYMLINSDKNFSEYVPEPVTALIGDYLPDNFKTKQQVVMEEQFEEIVEATSQVENRTEEVVEVVEVVETTVDAAQQQEVEQAAMQQEQQTIQQTEQREKAQQELEASTNQQNILDQDGDSVVEIAMQEIQNDLNGTSSVGNTVNDPKVKVIEKKIFAVSSKISKLDMENKELKEKFQNILRKNRDLAKQLQEIDKQLTRSN